MWSGESAEGQQQGSGVTLRERRIGIRHPKINAEKLKFLQTVTQCESTFSGDANDHKRANRCITMVPPVHCLTQCNGGRTEGRRAHVRQAAPRGNP